MKRISTFLRSKALNMCLLFILTLGANAQWLPKAQIWGASRSRAAAFTLGDKIYVVGGIGTFGNPFDQVWEYTISTDTWVMKPNFPGGFRYGATAFVIGNKGYVCGGDNINSFLNDLWEFDPATGKWTQKGPMPDQRSEAFSFVIGNKAYMGGGQGVVNSNKIALSDLWEYDPALDSWVQKASVPDLIGRNMATAGAVNNKGYMGLGCNINLSVNHQSFWEYDPATDTWTAKANYPTQFSTDAAAFTLNGSLYVVSGINIATNNVSNTVHLYDPLSDSWLLLTGYNSLAAAGEFAVSTGSRAFAGTGYDFQGNTSPDLWEFGKGSTQTFSLSANALCFGGSLASTAITQPTTPLNYVWSASPAGSISFVPSNTVAAPQIVVTNPATYTIYCTTKGTKSINTFSEQLTINDCTHFVVNSKSICRENTITTINTTTNAATTSYSWSAVPAGGVAFSPNTTAAAPQIAFTNPGVYTLICASSSSLGNGSYSEQIRVAACVGIEDYSSMEMLSVRPNPSNGIFEIVTHSEAPFSLTVTNALGEIILQPASVSNSNEAFQVDLSDQAEGIYFIHAVSGTKKYSRKLVLSR